MKKILEKCGGILRPLQSLLRDLINRWQRFSKRQRRIISITAVLCVLLSVLFGAFVQGNMMQPLYQTPMETEGILPEETETEEAVISIQSETEPVEENAYSPAVDRLNLAYLFPEGADEDDVLQSYAGEVYAELIRKDTKYIADLYDFAGYSPRELARSLGYPTSQLLGKYNPNDESHEKDAASTWYVSNFNNVNFRFYDADHQQTQEFSNVKDIMAMASVYCYQHDYTDAETFRAICLELYEKSRSYRVSIGNVYYDDGCIRKSVEEEAREALAEDEDSEEAAEAYDLTDAVFEEPESDGLTRETEAASMTAADAQASSANDGSSKSETDAEETEESADTEETEARITEINGIRYYVQYEAMGDGSRNRVKFVPVEDSTEAETATEADIDTEAAAEVTTASEETEADTEPAAAADTTGVYYTPELLDGGFQKTLSSYKGDLNGEGGPAGAETTTAAEEATATEGNSSAAAEADAAEGTEDGNPASSERQSTAESTEEETVSVSGDSALRSAEDAEDRDYCPGHVDLYVSVTIYGFSEDAGLRSLYLSSEDVYEAKDQYLGTDAAWQGWTEENIAAVQRLIAQDWYQEYGLSVSAIDPKQPLSSEEISAYLDSLPEDVSRDRKTLLRFALSSVGKVPYYYGGKAGSAGYEDNDFGRVISEPDYKGRILKGLDCSGWVQWVYWSALGNRLGGNASTANLVGVGKKIKRSELKPGDIIIRTGADSHVVMFLQWTADGKMLAVHETSSVNNVTVSEVTANYPYYRSILD